MRLVASIFLLSLIGNDAFAQLSITSLSDRSTRTQEGSDLSGIGSVVDDSFYSDLPTIEAELSGWLNENLPGTTTCALNSIMEMLRSRVVHKETEVSSQVPIWMQNSGVVAYYQNQLRESPCLAILMGEFYSPSNIISPNGDGSGDDLIPNGSRRASLAAFAGRGSFSATSPGHYYEQAKQIAEGDPVLAMEILGYCGHDDVGQNRNDTTSFSNDESALAVSNYLRRRASIPNDKTTTDLAHTMDRLVNGSLFQAIQAGGVAQTDIRCPSGASSFYAPGAIHPYIALSDETVRTIASVQAPSRGAQVLPAKAYHGTFAAVMGCKLASCGLGPEMAGKVMSGFGLTYRRIRMKQTTESYMRLAQLVQSELNVEIFNESDNETLFSDEFARRFAEWFEHRRPVITKEIGGEELYVANTRLSWNRMLGNMDAANLYLWSGYGHVRSYLNGSWDSTINDYISNPAICTMGAERCRKAMDTLETWMVDFKWTKEQQMRGAEFGARKCSGHNNSISNEQRACHALNQKHLPLSPCSQSGI
jgi:hypothetical protein